jgi:hypothetical protein
VVKFVFASEFPIEMFFRGSVPVVWKIKAVPVVWKKTVVKSYMCRIKNFENVDKTLFVYFISLYNFSSEIKIIKSEINVKLNTFATLK